jgi:hypothetical protein
MGGDYKGKKLLCLSVCLWSLEFRILFKSNSFNLMFMSGSLISAEYKKGVWCDFHAVYIRIVLEFFLFKP